MTNRHACLLRRQAAIDVRLTEIYAATANCQDPERMRLETELGELVEEIEKTEAPDAE